MAENFTARAPAAKESVGKNSASKKPGLVHRQTNLHHANPEVRLIGPGHEVYRSSDPAAPGLPAGVSATGQRFPSCSGRALASDTGAAARSRRGRDVRGKTGRAATAWEEMVIAFVSTVKKIADKKNLGKLKQR